MHNKFYLAFKSIQTFEFLALPPCDITITQQILLVSAQ